MTDPKNYLNVPFAQKDEAKALGAKWDAIKKKWYVPLGKDSALFAQWQTESSTVTSSKSTASKKAQVDSKTIASIKDFVAYNGEVPPWD